MVDENVTVDNEPSEAHALTAKSTSTTPCIYMYVYVEDRVEMNRMCVYVEGQSSCALNVMNAFIVSKRTARV